MAINLMMVMGLAPVVGIAMSELITQGRARVVDLAPFSPARFSSSKPPGEDFSAFWRVNKGDLNRV